MADQPENTRTVVGTTTLKNTLVVVCDDGTAWMWASNPEKIRALDESERLRLSLGQVDVEHCWIQFHQPIPGTRSDAAYQEARS